MCLNFSLDTIGWNVRPHLCEIRLIRCEAVGNAAVLHLHKSVNVRHLRQMDHLKNYSLLFLNL
jgi:hypothetical protein